MPVMDDRWQAIRDASSGFMGARVRMSADDAAQNITTEAAVTFDVVDFDTSSFFAAGTPNRLTIPAGVSYVDVVGQAYTTSSTADTSMIVNIRHYNSADALQRHFGSRFVEMALANRMMQAVTGPLAVAEGDYFQLWIREESDISVTVEGDDAGQTYLALHVLG